MRVVTGAHGATDDMGGDGRRVVPCKESKKHTPLSLDQVGTSLRLREKRGNLGIGGNVIPVAKHCEAVDAISWVQVASGCDAVLRGEGWGAVRLGRDALRGWKLKSIVCMKQQVPFPEICRMASGSSEGPECNRSFA